MNGTLQDADRRALVNVRLVEDCPKQIRLPLRQPLDRGQVQVAFRSPPFCSLSINPLHCHFNRTSSMGGAACQADSRYFSWMPKKDRKPKGKPSGEKWFVYLIRCADGSLYTGITTDVKRRCLQHNAGTASRYTRSRRPVKLIYQEVHLGQSSALKREAAIKAMNRRGKLTMIQQRKKPATGGRQIAHLEDIPNIGPAIAADFRQLGITSPADLPGRDPYAMYEDLCQLIGQRHDRCLLDTFIAAVRFMEGAPKKPWWKYTAERKREMAERRSGES